MTGYYFDMRRSVNGQYFFRFKAPNHETVVVSETYRAKASCEHAVNVLRSYAAGASVRDNTAVAA